MDDNAKKQVQMIRENLKVAQ
jgi:hypothetical protein